MFSNLHNKLLFDSLQQANAQGGAGSNEKDEKQKLECLASYSLFGNVMSMRSVTLPGAQRDALLLSFADAKVSV